MARPLRRSSTSANCEFRANIFCRDKDQHGTPLLQSERNAKLFIDVLRSNVAARRFQVHDFVAMPNHVHLLLTVGSDMTVERAMQFI